MTDRFNKVAFFFFFKIIINMILLIKLPVNCIDFYRDQLD